jgi:uncharacterized protein (UPF0335 family)
MPRGRKPKETPVIGAVKRDAELTKRFADRIDAKRAEQRDTLSDIGLIYQEAERAQFHRKALKEAIKLRRMGRNERNDYLGFLQIYCEDLGVWAQGDLFDDAVQIPTPPTPLDNGAAEDPEPSVGSYNYEIGRTAGHKGAAAGALVSPRTWEAGRAEGTREIEDGLADAPPEAAAIGTKRSRRRHAETDPITTLN